MPMTTLGSNDDAIDRLIRDLARFRHACGSPAYRELERLAQEILQRHKEQMPLLLPLSLTAISDVFNRKRLGPPRWGWVATLVLTCLHYAEQTGVRPDYPGPTDLREWHVRYQAMRAELDRLPPEETGEQAAPESQAAEADVARKVPVDAVPATGGGVPPVPSAPPGGTGRPAPQEPPVLRAEDMRDDRLRQSLDELPAKQSMAHRRYNELFGRHGVELLTAAERGDPEAKCRLGILLLCRGRPAEAEAWLASAADAGDETAQILVAARPSRRRQLAAEIAYDLTLPGYRQDSVADSARPSPRGAEAYYYAAAVAGHSGAMIRLGQSYEARGDYVGARTAFTEALRFGHPDARAHLERLDEQIDRTP
ncbi:MAG: hypothetical protein IRY90_08295 [Actinomadura rubrobrunea]|nr:hypothetical protein [Actinomadura rubrobrunea]